MASSRTLSRSSNPSARASGAARGLVPRHRSARVPSEVEGLAQDSAPRALPVELHGRAVQQAAAFNAAEVARVAYELFEQRGRTPGRELEDWLEAERLVRARRRSS